MRRIAGVLPFLAILTGPLVGPRSSAAQVIQGRLLDDSTAAPVSGARLVLLNDNGRSEGQTLTDSLGVFFFDARLGNYQLQAERIGYQTTLSLPFQVSVVDTLTVEFFINVEAIRLAPLIVGVPTTPGREIFAQRMEAEEGIFFTPGMVDSLRPKQHVGEIFRNADATWVQWTWGRHEDGKTGPLPVVYTYLGRDGCLNFIVDRTPIPAPFFEKSIWGVPPLSDLTPEDLVAIEVYRAWHEVPEDFQKQIRVRNGWEREALRRINRKSCGIVIIWTRDGW